MLQLAHENLNLILSQINFRGSQPLQITVMEMKLVYSLDRGEGNDFNNCL